MGIVLATAGSLAAPLSEFARGFTDATGHFVSVYRGPAGLLTQAIRDGLPAHVLVSASPDGPAVLYREGLFGPARLIARNRTVLVVRAGIYPAENPLDLLADPRWRIGLSTPGADPGGDYAAAFLDRLIASDPVRWSDLHGRCTSLFGATLPDPDAPRRSPAVEALRESRADMLIVYATTAMQITQALPGARMLPLPPEMAPLTSICACLRRGSGEPASGFFEALQDPICAGVLWRHGFLAA